MEANIWDPVLRWLDCEFVGLAAPRTADGPGMAGGGRPFSEASASKSAVLSLTGLVNAVLDDPAVRLLEDDMEDREVPPTLLGISKERRVPCRLPLSNDLRELLLGPGAPPLPPDP